MYTATSSLQEEKRVSDFHLYASVYYQEGKSLKNKIFDRKIWFFFLSENRNISFFRFFLGKKNKNSAKRDTDSLAINFFGSFNAVGLALM